MKKAPTETPHQGLTVDLPPNAPYLGRRRMAFIIWICNAVSKATCKGGKIFIDENGLRIEPGASEGTNSSSPGGQIIIASPGNSKVTLAWSTVPLATSYNLKRATVSGGPYQLLVTQAGTGHVDTGLTNGTTYYYVVSSIVGGNEITSSQASATPTADAAISGLHWEGNYNSTTAYTAFSVVRVTAGNTAGFWFTPVGAAIGAAPEWPENSTWILLVFGVIATTLCQDGNKTSFINATPPI